MPALKENSAEILCEKFDLPGKVISCKLYGNGHINDTYLIECQGKKEDNKKFILQHINPNVFKNIEAVMDNILKVTEHLKSKTDRTSNKVMNIVKTLDGNTYYIDDIGYFWRVYEFFDNSICLELPENSDDFYECAVAFGNFQRDLNDFPVDTLYEIIPDFHNTPKRYENFLNAVGEDKLDRVKEVLPEIEFINNRKSFYSVLNDSYEHGDLPLRVSHNDTKTNNVLLDKNTRKALCVIDLDTIMPGYSVNDFGDSIRFGASTASEDEKDLSKVKFDMEKFRVYTKGFLDGCGGLLQDSEIMLLPEGAKMMTIECGMRFLTDYLMGDTYFKTDRPGQNLDRCRTQLKLVSDMERQWDMMKACVASFIK